MPKLVLEGSEPALLCHDLVQWPIQTVTLDDLIRDAGGFLDPF